MKKKPELFKIMTELSKPGEPSKTPNDFRVSISDSLFFTGYSETIGKKEPLLVFPNPVDASELV